MGSSPLTRGKRHSQRDRLPTDRLIPAHAGKTSTRRRATASGGAHPRSRGENLAHVQRYADNLGSSPLTRGKRCQRSTRPPWRGLIPAHAGKTRPLTRPSPPRRAHPRSRGENDEAGKPVDADDGSSPLTRGKRGQVERPLEAAGLIPAHAGKTIDIACTRPLTRAHPRSRGENGPRRGRDAGGWGSSPLTRGKRADERGRAKPGGLIPAHAGKTPSRPARSGGAWAHPRSRGENLVADYAALKAWGSSPLTRGKRIRVDADGE